MPKISPGISQDILDDGKIIAYTVTDLNIVSLNDWNDTILESLKNWSDDNSMLLTLYDLSSKGVAVPYLVLNEYQIYNVAVTPSGRAKVDALLESRSNLRVRVALVLSETVSGKLTLKRGHKTQEMALRVQYKVFFKRDAALEWLRNQPAPPTE